MKFQKNDRIRAKDTGFQATVDGTSFNSIYQQDEVYIIWDHMPDKGLCSYAVDDVKDLWEKIEEAAEPGSSYVNPDGGITINLPSHHKGWTYEIHRGPSLKPKVCEHKWVEVGFMHTKTVCKHCDVEKT